MDKEKLRIAVLNKWGYEPTNCDDIVAFTSEQMAKLEDENQKLRAVAMAAEALRDKWIKSGNMRHCDDEINLLMRTVAALK